MDGWEASPKGFSKAFNPFSKHRFISNEAHSGLGWLSASLQSSGIPRVQVLILGSLSQSLSGQESTVTQKWAHPEKQNLHPVGSWGCFQPVLHFPEVFPETFRSWQSDSQHTIFPGVWKYLLRTQPYSCLLQCHYKKDNKIILFFFLRMDKTEKRWGPSHISRFLSPVF